MESKLKLPLEKGTSIGLVGGGQLGMFFTQSAQRMGYRVVCFCNRDDEPAARFADQIICGPFDDAKSIQQLTDMCSVVTYEFESIPAATLADIDQRSTLYPPLNVVQTSQDRSLEKQFLYGSNIPTAKFAIVESMDSLVDAVKSIESAAVLKTARDGYDGKGQWRVSELATNGELAEIWDEVDGRKCTLEKLIDLAFEVSVIVSADTHGNVVMIGPIRNRHENHILDTSWIDHDIDEMMSRAIRSIAAQVARELGLIGTLCVEFFVSRSGEILVNEIAPRPHNSGHLTIDAFSLSQFDLQALAVSGQTIRESEERFAAVMVNLLGDLWSDGAEPPFDQAAKVLDPCECRLHLYGKKEPRFARKMGHATIIGPTQKATIEAAQRYRKFLHDHASLPG